jgi:hypothetical protein
VARIANKAEIIEGMERNYKYHFKIAKYLLSANGGCLLAAAGVKEYTSIPQFSDTRAFVVIFGVGFLSSMVYYASVFLIRAVVLNALRNDEDPNDSVSADPLKVVNVVSLIVAAGALAVAIVLAIWRSVFA